ncbi:hypothetical protein Daus18300_006245 [Diaporthe australafricana]|uniref:Di19 zinc-binding domain-containing protein n=1 Tax=Diaporthe australafricana TaxID=127596 RepID=A0ABR3WW36_9PEZI
MPSGFENFVSEVVSLLVLRTAPDVPTSLQHQESFQRIIDHVWREEWDELDPDEQVRKRRAIQDRYKFYFEFSLRAFPTRSQATKISFELDSAPHTGPVHEPENVFDGMTEEEILQSDVARERDQAAKKNLKDLYDACQQGRADVVVRRAKEQDVNVAPFDSNTLPIHDKKKKTCPICGKNVSNNAIKRHYQVKHFKDPRKAVFCPKCTYVEWRGDSTILEHLKKKHNISMDKKGDETSKGKATTSNSSEDDSQESEEAEEAEEVQVDEGEEEVDDEEMMDTAP